MHVRSMTGQSLIIRSYGRIPRARRDYHLGIGSSILVGHCALLLGSFVHLMDNLLNQRAELRNQSLDVDSPAVATLLQGASKFRDSDEEFKNFVPPA
jgi:hypothetical protein